MCLHGGKTKGHKFSAFAVRSSLDLFLRSRNACRAMREYLILPCEKTLRSYFGKLGSAGSLEECKTVIANVFEKLSEQEKMCFITADEIYVKASVRYRAGHIIGMSVDQDSPALDSSFCRLHTATMEHLECVFGEQRRAFK